MENKEMALIENEKPKLSTVAHLMAGWPLFLVIIGGAIGGALGVVAYVVNRKIYLSQLSNMQKVLANLLCGMSAISLWWFIATWLQGYMAN
ncbi:hypothetical protein B9T36_06905 [Acinetobacter sp. ANC 4204]|uniref:hypothetical protein n=1 Tax=unclassified Acinetobacter TaxID=196816 RepID=UPI000A335AB6|nr:MULTISPECIES: hypothetical protein [unclassified Acinetobacter]OTG60344.1 hypothetical protein B9T36_06905 [Acinetobacter sp. ANC 4204]